MTGLTGTKEQKVFEKGVMEKIKRGGGESLSDQKEGGGNG